MNKVFSLIALACSLALAPALATAQYPVKPVRLIIPFAVGGPTDTVARTVGQALSKSLGQPVIVESKPGADGAIAAQTVASAPADGYTLLFAVSSMTAIPLLTKPAPFDLVADFTPVSLVGRFAFCMYLHPGVPATSVAEFVTYAKANPGKLNYATSNLGEHLAATQFMKATGIDMVRVPYKGAAQAMPDLIAGRVQVNFGPLSGGLPYVIDGRLRALAILLPQRISIAPNIPTMAEAGVQGVSVLSWQAIFAPAKTPKEIVNRLAREVNAVLQETEVRVQLDRQALYTEGSTPQALAATLQEDTRAWSQFIRENGLVPE